MFKFSIKLIFFLVFSSVLFANSPQYEVIIIPEEAYYIRNLNNKGMILYLTHKDKIVLFDTFSKKKIVPSNQTPNTFPILNDNNEVLINYSSMTSKGIIWNVFLWSPQTGFISISKDNIHRGMALNNHGQVLLQSYQNCYLWKKGELISLPIKESFDKMLSVREIFAWHMNDHGEILATIHSKSSASEGVFVYKEGKITRVHLIDGFNPFKFDNNGEIWGTVHRELCVLTNDSGFLSGRNLPQRFLEENDSGYLIHENNNNLVVTANEKSYLIDECIMNIEDWIPDSERRKLKIEQINTLGQALITCTVVTDEDEYNDYEGFPDKKKLKYKFVLNPKL